jgi:hypothetical protein
LLAVKLLSNANWKEYSPIFMVFFLGSNSAGEQVRHSCFAGRLIEIHGDVGQANPLHKADSEKHELGSRSAGT